MDSPFRGYPIKPNPQYIPAEKPGIKLSWILGIIFIFVVGGVASLFLLFSGGGTKQNISNETNEGVSAAIIECGTDIDCFIDETYKCNLANLTYDFTVNLLGWIQDHSYYYEMKGGQSNSCVLYIKIKNVSGSYDDARIQHFLGNNMTQDEINQQEQEINGALRTTIGSNWTYTLKQKKLTQMFIDLKSGNFSSGDFGVSTKEPMLNSSIESGDTLELGISLSKNSYEVGEKVEGEFSLSYEGNPFEGVILYTNSRSECNKSYYSVFVGIIETGSFSDGTLSIFREALQAFRLDKVDDYGSCSYVAGTDYFYEEGTYAYGISVYNCSSIENQLNKDCSEAEFSEIVRLIPLKSVSKNVFVSGGSYTSECKVNNDCTNLCGGCESGKQLCRLPSEVCSDCINNFDCKEGYKCENYACVLE